MFTTMLHLGNLVFVRICSISRTGSDRKQQKWLTHTVRLARYSIHLCTHSHIELGPGCIGLYIIYDRFKSILSDASRPNPAGLCTLFVNKIIRFKT